MFQPSIDPRQDRPTRFVLLLPLLFVLTGMFIRWLAIRHQLPEASIDTYFQTLCRWDCQWYVRMAETGYDPFPVPARVSAGNWAFFPFYPMLVGLIAKVIPLPTIALASIISMITAYLSVVLAWPLLGRRKTAYALFAAFMLSGPLSMYFTTFFTEVMFVLLSVLTFRLLGRSNYLGASVAIAFLSATRIVGVFATLSLGLQALLDYRRNTGGWRGVVGGLLGQPRLVLAIFIAPLGLFFYMAFLHYWIGDGLAFSHVQRAWGRQIASPLYYLWRGLVSGPNNGVGISPSQMLALAAVAGLALTGVLAWRRQWPAALFTLICILVPLAAGLASMLRFMAGMAPLTITLMTLLGRNLVVFWLSLAVLLGGAWFGTIGWLGGHLALV